MSSPRITTAPMGTSSMSAARRACSSAAALPLSTHWLSRPLEAQRVSFFGSIDAHAIALGVLPLEYRYRERVLQQPLDRALQGPRSVHGVVALGDEQLLRGRRNVDRELAIG